MKFCCNSVYNEIHCGLNNMKIFIVQSVTGEFELGHIVQPFELKPYLCKEGYLK